MKAIETGTAARFVTRCGCSREVEATAPFEKFVSIPMTLAPSIVAGLSNAALFKLFADERAHRVFVLDHIERPSPSRVVGIYHEREER